MMGTRDKFLMVDTGGRLGLVVGFSSKIACAADVFRRRDGAFTETDCLSSRKNIFGAGSASDITDPQRC